MKAISMWQPWATLLALKIKQFETRSWQVDYRGPIAIHAAKTEEQLELLVPGSVYFEALKEADFEGPLPLGAIIATGELLQIYPIEMFREISERERSLGDFSAGRYAWRIRIDKVLKDPIPARGRQSLWNWERA